MTTPLRHHSRNPRTLLAGVAFAVIAVACGGGGGEESRSAIEPVTEPEGVAVSGPAVPTSTFETFDGETVSLTGFAGRPLVVNFWASWCPSCVAEMSAAFKPVQEAVGDQVTFVGMNIQDERSRAEDLLEITGVEWINAEDPRGDLYVELGGLGMPFTVFVDASGEILDTHNGPLSESQLNERITELLLG